MFKPSVPEQNPLHLDGALESAQTAAAQAIDSVGRVMGQGVERARETSHMVRERAARATESTANYIRHDPVKSVLIAAATGAALMALVSLLNRSNNRH
jgi:ElaB/YqjD/DUF883 family membrane-anchored ribosome-binding protein